MQPSPEMTQQQVVTISDVQHTFGNEMGSITASLPSADQALTWAAAMIESWHIK